MNLLWIFLIISMFLNIGFFVFLFIYIKKNNKNRIYNEQVTKELIETKKKPIIIWLVSRYKEEELELLLKNPEVLDLLLRIFEYKIAIKTDSIRRPWKESSSVDEKIGFVNCLHETHLMFYNLKQKLNKDTQKNLTNLI